MLNVVFIIEKYKVKMDSPILTLKLSGWPTQLKKKYETSILHQKISKKGFFGDNQNFPEK